MVDQLDEIVSIEYVGFKDTIDINVTGDRLFWANDILTHNSAVEEVEFDHSHIAGGISKINTADNVFGIFTSRAMRERGKYQMQCMKSRSSTGVGMKVDLDYKIETMRITDSGEDAQNNSGFSSKPQPSLMASIRTPSTVTAASDDTARVTADVQGAKLRQLLGKIKSG